MSTVYRQGDVLIMKVEAAEVPAAAAPQDRDAGRIVLAYGEVTGHAHAIADVNATLLMEPLAPGATAEAADRWLRVGAGGVTLRHEEHAPIALGEGTFLVRRQREYQPEAVRYVAD